MNKIFLFAIILVSSSSKTFSPIKLGINTTFNYTHSDLEYQYIGPGNDLLIFYVKFFGKNMDYTIMCGYEGIAGILFGKELIETVPQMSKNQTCTLEFKMKEGEEGTVVIYALNIELSIDLKYQYGSIYESIAVDDYDYKKILGNELTFSVQKLEKDVTTRFQYNNKVKIINSYYTLENPFQVCLNNDCQKIVRDYKFEKGKSYKIKVKITRMTNIYNNKFIIVPGFTFYEINNVPSDDSENYSKDLEIKLLFIFLLLLLL